MKVLSGTLKPTTQGEAYYQTDESIHLFIEEMQNVYLFFRVRLLLYSDNLFSFS